MTLEERGAYELLVSAKDYLHNKSYRGDDGPRWMTPNHWFDNNIDAIVSLNQCISKLRLEAACTTQK